MTRRKRRNHASAFKAKVALAAVKGERTLSELRALGRQVVLVGPVPEVGWNVPRALAMQSHTGIQRTIRPTREAFHDRQAFVIETMATLGPAYGATIVLPHESLCSEELCRIESMGRPCPSSNKWDRCLVLLRACFAHHFHMTRRVVDSANGALSD